MTITIKNKDFSSNVNLEDIMVTGTCPLSPTADRLTDDDIRQYLRGRWHLEHPTDLQKKEKTDRDEILVEAIKYGIPLRQLSRMTGISYGVIQRTHERMKSQACLSYSEREGVKRS